jgi:hypothetical protein
MGRNSLSKGLVKEHWVVYIVGSPSKRAVTPTEPLFEQDLASSLSLTSLGRERWVQAGFCRDRVTKQLGGVKNGEPFDLDIDIMIERIENLNMPCSCANQVPQKV